MKQKKLRSLSAVLLIGWCLIFLRCETTEKSMVRVFAMVDTNSDPSCIDFVIPCNDDASTSISLVIDRVADAIKEGLSERKAEKDKEGTEKKPAAKKVEKVAEGEAEEVAEEATEEQ